MKNSALKTAAILSGMIATSAFAQGETGSPASKAGATFWIDHNVLTWSTDKAEPENGNDTEATRLQTTPDDVTIGIFWKNYGIYVMPGQAGGAVGLSLFPQKEIEVGVLLGTNREKAETDNGPETETTSDTIGLFGTYYLELDSISTAEFTAKYVYGKSEVESEAGGVTTTTDNKSNRFEIGAQYAYQIAEHFHIIPGIFFHTGSAETEVAGNKSEDDASGITVNLAHFRYVF